VKIQFRLLERIFQHFLANLVLCQQVSVQEPFNFELFLAVVATENVCKFSVFFSVVAPGISDEIKRLETGKAAETSVVKFRKSWNFFFGFHFLS
jgi:hypothetical protein